MKQKHSQFWLWRGSGALVVASLALPMVGCGSNAPAPTSSGSGPAMTNTQSRPKAGLTTKNKVILLAGAAALFYYYNKSKKANEAKYAGQTITYYRSKNGRIYYREPGNPKNVIWVTPPPANYSQPVPAEQAQQYNGYEGYNNAPSGKTLEDAFPTL